MGLGTVSAGVVRLPERAPAPIHDALADAVLRLIPEGARLQYGPGQLGSALLRRTRVPLHIDTGLLTDAVVGLDDRGLLAGIPSATYLLGSEALYDWADGRPILRGVDYTHDLSRLSRGAPLFAVNTAIELDSWGQVNVEGVGEKVDRRPRALGDSPPPAAVDDHVVVALFGRHRIDDGHHPADLFFIHFFYYFHYSIRTF